MQLSDFDYILPEELVAQEPLKERDQARLMVIDRKTRTIDHDVFANLGRHLPPKSLLVANNSKVIAARLLGTKTRSGGEVEIFLLDPLEDGYSYRVMLRPARRIKDGDEVVFQGSDIKAAVVSKDERVVRFNKKDVVRHLETIGHIPLPPYIKREDTVEDREFYQTVYARHSGSVAAPTAGLHFTRKLIHDLKSDGHRFEQVMLHVNYATFKPVEEEKITDHQMHEEEYDVPREVWHQVSEAKAFHRPVVAVGTTSCRTLEAVARTQKLKGKTDLFLYPGKEFKIIDALITNFHLPRSSLLMLVYAFGGVELMRRAYAEAIENRYRFYSYGDAMLIK
ncbi:MAG: tRNA preQ1(34) S-adenosylmethionine ribosyltransferase-isomerase QueA [Candidatus Omnitrophota bacterium]